MIFILVNGCQDNCYHRDIYWIKCHETKKVFILDKEGAIECTYIDKK